MSDLTEKRYEVRPGQFETVWLRELPAIEFSRFFQRQRSEDLETRAFADFQFLAAGLRKSDGDPLYTADELANGRWPYRTVKRASADLLELNGYVISEKSDESGNKSAESADSGND